jgi:Rps23 Pro-64 3,4-dihydroxylase Tpa1-like proline 4-hydroxylase
MNNSITNDFYIYTIKNSLSKSLCEEIIDRFEKEDKKRAGITYNGEDKNVKDTLDFHLSVNPECWKDIDKVLTNELGKALEEYFAHINKDISILLCKNVSDLGFQIQKYEKGVGKYIFHNDHQVYHRERLDRAITYIWYLNDVEEGGETSFFNKGKVRPEQGKLVLFPSCWTYPHSGIMPISHHKYIITGWVLKGVGSNFEP